jgi:hypothetical protein
MDPVPHTGLDLSGMAAAEEERNVLDKKKKE